MDVPRLTLNDENSIPQLGLGVWQAKDGGEVEGVVSAALEAGYRLVDTAAAYGNERGVGKAVRESTVPREDVFVTTKLWNGDHGHDKVLKAFDASLERLGLDYIDLYLIHWPAPSRDLYVETWKALLEIKESGRAKSVGVCNFGITELDRIIKETGVTPAVNQIELHPHLQQEQLRAYCEDKGIRVESWSPIGGTGGNLLEDETLATLAEKHGKSPAQIVLRWHVQLGLIVIPKSVNPERIRQNIDVFGFTLDDDDMRRIASINTDTRRGPDPATFGNSTNTSVVQLAHKLGLVKFRKQ